ncbi:MAG: hypothetical protein QXT77_06670 [Candidatus Methanomethylicaceae archaeon]
MNVTFSPIQNFETTPRSFTARDGSLRTYISGRTVATVDGKMIIVDVLTAEPMKFAAGKPITAELRSFEYSRDAGIPKLRVKI